MPEPSVLAGYYEDAFVLKLTAPANGQIYYTTDGSTPTTSSHLYRDGIEIVNRSQEKNVYRSIQNVVRFWKYYTPSSETVEKGTVIRAICVNENGVCSEVLTQTYFVGIEPPEHGYTLSLIFEYDDLFGENGIYITGRKYDAWYSVPENPKTEPEPNFMKHLKSTATAELLERSGDFLIQPVELRIQGSSSRERPIKRFSLFARAELSGREFFEIPLFEDTLTHSVMLKSDLPDAIAADLLVDRSVAVQRSVPVRVYLNGEYMCDSFMLERYDDAYFRQHYGVKKGILVKNGVVDDETMAKSYQSTYDELLHWIENMDFSEVDYWSLLSRKIDIQSYIDFIVTNYYFFNFDFATDWNHVLWRSVSKENAGGGDTRWRWCIYDIDAINYSPTNDRVKQNTFLCDYSSISNKEIIFRTLRQSSEFNRQFVLSFMDMVNNNFAIPNVARVLNKYGETLDWMDGFFRLRPQYAPRHLAEEFGLTGTLETVRVTTADPKMGRVKVNTSVIDLSSGSWSGQYFTDYPITLIAEAAQGYRFVGWKGGSVETDNSITVPVDGGIALEAVFAEK